MQLTQSLIADGMARARRSTVIPGMGINAYALSDRESRSPRSKWKSPARAIIAALSVASRGVGANTSAPSGSTRSRIAVDERAIARDAAAEHDALAAELPRRARRLLDERVDDRVLKGARDRAARSRSMSALARTALSTAVLSPLNETS